MRTSYFSWQSFGHHCLPGLSPSSLAPLGDAGSLAGAQKEAESWLNVDMWFLSLTCVRKGAVHPARLLWGAVHPTRLLWGEVLLSF